MLRSWAGRRSRKKVSTPSLPEETKQSQPRIEIGRVPLARSRIGPRCSENVLFKHSGRDVKPEESPRGALAPHAASVLVKMLYAARIARFDLLRSINVLAQHVIRWTYADDDDDVVMMMMTMMVRWCDARFQHLVCYVNSTLELKMAGWVGNDVSDLSLAA